MSLTYQLQHKHPFDYQQVVHNNRHKGITTSFQGKSLTNFFSCQSNKPVSDKVSVDLKIVIAQWIARSGRPTTIVEDAGLGTVLHIAFQNQTYTLPSRRSIDATIERMYDEKLREHMKATENSQSLALTTDFWTLNSDDSYCDITGHWIDSDWKLTSVALGCLR